MQQEDEDKRAENKHQVPDEHQRAEATGVGPVPGARREAAAAAAGCPVLPFLLKPAQQLPRFVFLGCSVNELFGERRRRPQVYPPFG